MSISEPAKITTPWADTGSKNQIPANANNTTGVAGFDKGFPDITMTPAEAGGIPPAGQDFNGIFYQITEIIRYMQAGGLPTFSPALAVAIGGYPKGATIISDDKKSFYTSKINANTSNPNIGGDGWFKRVNRNDIAHPKDYGAIADGSYHPLSEIYTSLSDAQAVYPHATSLSQSIDWAAFQSALNSGTGTVDYRSGKYFVNDNLSRNADINLIGDKSSKIIMVGAVFAIEGSLTALPDLSVNVTTLSRSLTFSSAPSISPGDTVLLFNPTDYSWSQHRPYYRAGEFFKVHSLSGSVASIYGLPSDPYIAAAVDMYRVDGVSVTMQDVHVEGDAGFVGAPMVVRFGVDVEINGWRGSVSQSYQLEIDRCYGVGISSGSAVNNSPYAGDEYGIILSNSSNITVNCGNHFATRHAIALGGGAGVGSIPCRNVKIIGANLFNTGVDIGASDIHGNCDNVQYINCEINAHANMAGRGSKYINCRIHQRTSPSDGSCVWGSEIVGGQFDIIDCELITQGDLNASGAIMLSMVTALKQDLTVKVRNLTVRGGAGGPLAKIVRISAAAGESNKINTDIRGVRCELSQALCVLYVRCDASPSQIVVSNGHIVDDIYGPAGMALIQDTGAAIAGVPTRQMRQCGYVDVTTSVTTAEIAAPASFRYKYSKIPTATVAVSSPNGSAKTTIGGQPASPVIYTLSESQIRAGAVAPVNMVAGDPVRMHWASGISEI